MRLRRLFSGESHEEEGPADELGTDGLDRIREAGERVFAAGDAAIRRTLSGDSEAFLRASRQQGGQ